jgi:2-oxoglutarate dehydrogenase E1 component
MDNRAKMIETGEGIDWATGEALAFGSLVQEGTKIRLSGQDVRARHVLAAPFGALRSGDRGTLHSARQRLRRPTRRATKSSTRCCRKRRCSASNTATRWREPNALTLWEAQFGDFANGAQVLFDQFISSGERKWLRMSGLVCLLPHGYEGQGPEHSSARLERFLQMCAEDNMQVANCTTPANYFHILRRQMKRDFRKPLIMMTPKSLLRHKRAVSTLEEMSGDTSFHRLLWDDAELLKNEPIKLVKDNKIRRVVMCSGKVYFDLLRRAREARHQRHLPAAARTALPVPGQGADQRAVALRSNAEMVWCQEEPKNMGAWSFIEPYLEWVLAHIDAKYQRVRYTGRSASASTATGLMSRHLAQLEAFLEDALGG